MPSVRSTIGAKLQQDPSITHIVTLGAPIALAALESVSDAGQPGQGRHVRPERRRGAGDPGRHGSCSPSTSSPTCRATWPSTSLWLYLTNGNDIGGGGPVLTGPSFVDTTNIEQILPYAAEQHPLSPAPGGSRRAGSPRAPPGPTLESSHEHIQWPHDATSADARPTQPPSGRQGRSVSAALLGPPGDRGARGGDRDLHLLLRRRPAVPHAAGVVHGALRELDDRHRRRSASALLMIGGEFDLSAGVAVVTGGPDRVDDLLPAHR